MQHTNYMIILRFNHYKLLLTHDFTFIYQAPVPAQKSFPMRHSQCVAHINFHTHYVHTSLSKGKPIFTHLRKATRLLSHTPRPPIWPSYVYVRLYVAHMGVCLAQCACLGVVS